MNRNRRYTRGWWCVGRLDDLCSVGLWFCLWVALPVLHGCTHSHSIAEEAVREAEIFLGEGQRDGLTSEELAGLQAWLNDNRTGWKQNWVTLPAPEVMIRSEQFVLSLNGRSLFLAQKDAAALVRNLGDNDLEFFRSLGSDEKAFLACEISKTSGVRFSTERYSDILSVSISGQSCAQSRLTITISSSDGEALYTYQAPFKRHTPTHADDPGLPQVAERLVNSLMDDDSFGRTSELPNWLPALEYYEAHYQELQLSEAEYEALRTQIWPTYEHLTYYEGWRIIAFDRDRNLAIVVSEGGL